VLDRGDDPVRSRHDDIDLQPCELRGERGEPFLRPLREPALEHDVPAFHVPEIAERILEGLDEVGPSSGVVVKMTPIRNTFPGACARAADGATRSRRTTSAAREGAIPLTRTG
jgi:hypothetical protein